MVSTRIKTYGELVMFSHTLFSVPFGLSAMLLAAQGLPSPRVFLWVMVALVSARTAANALNRLVDRKIDAKNPRTARRHLPAGKVSLKEVIFLIAFCLLALTAAAFMLNPLCVILLPVPLFLFFTYSFTKRFTWTCHLVLGIACGGAPVGAWLAVTGGIGLPSLVMGAAVMFWVAGFDIIYGAQDEAFDREENLSSIPVEFGIPRALQISSAFHVLAVLLLACLIPLAGLGPAYWAGLAITAGLLFYEHKMVSPGHLENVKLASYSINQIVSIILLLSVIVDVLLRTGPK